MVRVVMSMGADTEANIWGPGGALERGHRASLERLAELGDTLGGVGALAILDAEQRVVGQAVSMTKEECQGALTESRTLGPTAHLSEVTALSLSPSHNLAMPSAV